MKSYRRFIFIFGVLLIIYVVAELNRPRPIDWTVTLSKEDKNPYGAWVLFHRLKDLFADADISSWREPAYNLFEDNETENAAYIVIAPSVSMGTADLNALMRFAERGNHVLIASYRPSEQLMDTLGLETDLYLSFGNADSITINFVNPSLRADRDYGYLRNAVDEYFSAINKDDSTVVLGTTHKSDPNFVRVNIGEGAVYFHASPLVFSNHAMLSKRNYEYVAKALSYIPSTVDEVYWDEYYKLGRTGPRTPLRVFLSNEWLRWALRLSLVGLLVYMFVEMKRRQRIIPIIAPLRNTTLDFIKTVAAVYLSQKDNRSIANNKIQYWLQYVRQHYYLQTNELNEHFIRALARKAGVPETTVEQIIHLITEIQTSYKVTDAMLLELNHRIDQFYTLSKS